MRRTHRTSHRIRTESDSSGNPSLTETEAPQLPLPVFATRPELPGVGPSGNGRVSDRSRRAPRPRRRGDDDQRQALQLALELAERSVASTPDDGASAVEAARRAAMERSREALRARLKLVPTAPAPARGATGEEAGGDSNSFPVDPPPRHEAVPEEPSEVVFVGRLPPKGTHELAELVADRLSLPPPRGGFPLQRSSGGALFEHRTAKAWLRISRVSSGLHVLLAGEARSRWLGDIRAAVRELGLVEAE